MLSRLTALHINIIGIVTALILSVALFFFLIKPKNEQLEQKKTETATVEGAGGTQVAVNGKKTELKREQTSAAKVKEDWSHDSVYYMPRFNLGAKADPLADYHNAFYTNERGEEKGVKEIPTEWGRWVEKWYDAQARNGITRGNPIFPIEAFPTDPNAFISVIKPSSNGTSQLTFPAPGKPWQVTVICKDFDSAMHHLEQFNRMKGHGMPVISNVALEGQSPFLTMTYDLLLYVIPNADPPPVDSRIAPAGGSTGGGGGGFGGGSFGPYSGPPSGGGSRGGYTPPGGGGKGRGGNAGD